MDWKGDISEHLFLLQEKLNAYLRFVESGELLESYPKAVGKSVVFAVVMKFAPTDEAQKFFRMAEEVINGAGIRLEWEQLLRDKSPQASSIKA
ncbi:MAG: DUF6572 domain-containing protein [Acidobacteriota bacterium]